MANYDDDIYVLDSEAPTRNGMSSISYPSDRQSGIGIQKALLSTDEDGMKDLPLLDANEFPDCTITIELEKKTDMQKLGIRSHPLQGSHCLTHIWPTGLIADWNRANPDNQVQRGDHIVECNGSPFDMRKEFSSGTKLCMKLIAAEVLVFEISKNADEMLGIMTRAGSRVHQILSIKAGSSLDLVKFGQTHSKVKTIRSVKPKVGDYIIEVNGMAGNAEILREEWISNTKIELVVMSPRQSVVAQYLSTTPLSFSLFEELDG